MGQQLSDSCSDCFISRIQIPSKVLTTFDNKLFSICISLTEWSTDILLDNQWPTTALSTSGRGPKLNI